ncbi:MAG: restriction endonuclease [Candidatus Absconditabacteria bacterium]
MALYEEILKDPITGIRIVIKANDYYSFIEKRNKKINQFQKKADLHNGKEYADQKDKECKKKIEENNNILNYTLNYDDKINRDELIIKNSFNEYIPIKPDLQLIKENIQSESSFFYKILFSRKISEKANLKYQLELGNYENSLVLYNKNKESFELNKIKHNERISNIKSNYENNINNGTKDYIGLVLERSKYPNDLMINFDMYYDINSKLFIVDMDLPSLNDISNLIGCKYITSKGITEDIQMKQKEFENYYNNIIYQICLRTLHEIFESDYKKNVDIVVFNGWVSGVDKKTGNDMRNCIMTIQTVREIFENINLSRIDIIECFRGLKGVTAGSLINLSPVKPIMKVDYNDRRIIEASEVIDDIGDMNLAQMDWKEFEILIRDLFNKMFGGDGCKVDVTQASRDAGVDAIIFDEDPIRGGKYVVQAKRYNNIVPLTAVRDLYGTMMNEGAVKGILVTTSYFGKDSLEFVKDKPIKLINGEELLYWFNEHGYKMKIELANKRKAVSKNSF